MHMTAFAICVAALVCSPLRAASEEVDVPSSGYWRIKPGDEGLAGLFYDPQGANGFGLNLLYKPLLVESGGSRRPVTPSDAAFEEGGAVLRITAPSGAEAGAMLLWPIDFGPEGYYDRLTGETHSSGKPDHPGLTRFISGHRGHTTPIEAFKRIDVERFNAGAIALWALATSGGRSTIVETAAGPSFLVDGKSVRHNVTFRFEGGRLLARFPSDDGVFRLRPYIETGGIRLEGGEKLPYFVFGDDAAICNSVGGETGLTKLFNEFYQQAAFWYPAGHGISAWAAWGPLGHAYVNAPYRIDSRNALVGQVIADDGYGHDGLAYAWGDQPGWPFPSGYDTRHFGINAMHICGQHTYLFWTGEHEKLSGIDFSLRVLREGRATLEQNASDMAVTLLGGHRYAQAFDASESFDGLALNLRVPEVDVTAEGKSVTESAAFPAEGSVSDPEPYALCDAPSKTLAQRLRPEKPFNTVGVMTCNWAKAGSGARFRVFRWQGDYALTVTAAPLGETVKDSVPDNQHVFVLLPETLESGTEILVLVDRPTAPEEGQTATTGLWHVAMPAGERFSAAFAGGEPWPGRSLRVTYGIRIFPEADVRVMRGEEEVFAKHVSLPEGDGYWGVPLGESMPPGAYTVELVPSAADMAWRASRVRTALGGRAAYDGHSWNWLDRARRAMAYQMQWLNAREENLVKLDGKAGDRDHLGVSGESVGNNYYDILPFGYFDGYINAWFYDSVRAMADLETAYGDPERAAALRAVLEPVRRRYNEVFWTDKGYRDGAARYIGCVDANGNRRDYGFTFVNTLALHVGLAKDSQADAVLKWLGTGSTFGPGGTRTPEDLYHFRFAPRCTTIDNPDWWAAQQRYEAYPWGEQIQNGGADLYESYYDLMARLAARGADDAYERLLAILARYAEPDRLTGGGRLFTGESVQGGGTAGAVGVMSYEFPETSILAGILLYGFIGAEAGPDGLHIAPKIPRKQPFIRAENIYYHGTYFDIEAAANRLSLRCRPDEGRQIFAVRGQVFEPPFEWEGVLVAGEDVVIKPVTEQ